MKKLIFSALLMVVCGLVHGQNLIQKVVKVDDERYLEYNGIRYTLSPKYILVKPKSSMKELNPKIKPVHYGEFGYIDIEVPDDIDVVYYVDSLKKTGEFETVEYLGNAKCYFSPNDSLFTYQHPISRLNYQTVWDITKGSPNVKVAIIDTGVWRDHPDLGYGNDNYTNISYSMGYDYFAGTTYQIPTNGHGTSVAGIIGAKMHNNCKGVAGISGGNNSSGVTLMSYHAIEPDNTLSSSYIGDAIKKAVDQGAKVINISAGSPYSSKTEDAISYAIDHGTTIICSSGNEGRDYLSYPASNSNTIAVGASDFNGNWDDDCNYGPGLDIIAPGDITMSTNYHIGYSTFNATSSAAAITSGTVALMLSVNPSLSPSQIRSILHNTAKKLTGYDYNSLGWEEHVGYGELHPFAAVLSACNTEFTKSSVICPTPSTYTINNLPPDLYVTWHYLGDDNSVLPPFLINSTDSTCTVENYNSNSFSGTIYAYVRSGSGTTVLTILKKRVRGVSPLTGTFHQEGGYYHYQNYPSFTRSINSSITVNQMCTITLQSPKFKDMNIRVSQGGSYVQSFSFDGNQTITFVAAYNYTDKQFVISGTGNDGSCNDFNITVHTTKTPIQPLKFSMSASVDDGKLEVEVKSLASDGSIQTNRTWALEVNNITTGAMVFCQKVKDSNFIIDTTGWKPGVYIVRVTIGKEKHTEKVVVK